MSAAGSAVPLWQQLQQVALALDAVRAGRSLTPTLEAVDSRLRPGVQALTFHVLRWLGRAEALRSQLARRPPPPLADALLCSALALAWRADDAPYEPFTLVDQAVEAAKRSPAMRAQANFVNACLRRFLRERDLLLNQVANDPVAVWNHPRWWVDQLRQDHPGAWQDILRGNNAPGAMVLRVNVRQTSQADYLAALAAAGIDAAPLPAPTGFAASGIVLRQACPVQALPGFAEGWVSVQDTAAQMAAPLLLHGLQPQAPGTRLRVLDACAAPGGKTAHLLELANADVLALDVDPVRCSRVRETLARLGLQADVRCGDAADPDSWWDGQPFDAILLDAPCTASGIVRRHPDVRWLRRPTDLAQLAGIQARLLQQLWPLLRPGGRLLYATCSVFKAEGDRQVETFVAHNTQARWSPSPGHLLPSGGVGPGVFPDNAQGEHDGFYYALLDKLATA